MIRKTFVQVGGKELARVTFTLPSSLWAGSLHLVGNFNDWSKTANPFPRDEDGNWTLTLDLETRRTFEFRYLRDNTEWMNDTQADSYVTNPYGSHNFVVNTDPPAARPPS